MCQSKATKPITTATGQSNNADANTVSIIENIQDHSSVVTILLIVIIVILAIHLIIKLYKEHRGNIIKQDRFRSRMELAGVRLNE